MSVPTRAGVPVGVYGKWDCGLEVDIESSPVLHEACKERIPPVVVNGRLAFTFRIDEAALRRRLAREGAPDGARPARGALTGPAPPARPDTP